MYAQYFFWTTGKVLNQTQIIGLSKYISIQVFHESTLSLAVGSRACWEEKTKAFADSTQDKNLSCILEDSDIQINKTINPIINNFLDKNNHNTNQETINARSDDLERVKITQIRSSTKIHINSSLIFLLFFIFSNKYQTQSEKINTKYQPK